MRETEMREKLCHFIENVEQKRMKAIYMLFENEMQAEEWEYTDEFKAELDRRYEYYMNGGKMISSEQADKQTAELLQKIKSA